MGNPPKQLLPKIHQKIGAEGNDSEQMLGIFRPATARESKFKVDVVFKKKNR